MSDTAIKMDGLSLITSDLIRSGQGDPAERSDQATLDAAASRVFPILTLAEQGFLNGTPARDVVARLIERLHELRRTAPAHVWDATVAMVQNHPVRRFLLQDPLTNWSVTKPRGYSGDASLLDIYYKHPSMDHLLAECSPLGREIYEHTSNDPACEAGRERCRILAQTVDEATERAGGASEILAVAAGHLREAEICSSLSAGRIRRWVALDQDPVSVGVMTRDLAGHGAVQPMNGSVMGILRRSYDLGSFDLVYASGLFDYLPTKTGVRLMQRLVEMVRPGGTFLFANFSDEVTSDGYMETFMDWPLILRSEADMWEIINASVDRNLFEATVRYGTNRNLVYGELRRH